VKLAVSEEVDELYLKMFDILAEMRTSLVGHKPNEDTFRFYKAKLKPLLDEFRKGSSKVSSEERELILYAIVAWVDGVIINRTDGCKAWQDTTLEAEYYREFKAADRFFENAEQAINSKQADAIEAYLLSFMFGYHGRLEGKNQDMRQWQTKAVENIRKSYPSSTPRWEEDFDASPEIVFEELHGSQNLMGAIGFLFAVAVIGSAVMLMS
jgi:type IV/VI secretion system ImpK/VasF family protein